MFVVNLDTSTRLNICEPAKSIARNTGKEHPIHYAAFDGKCRKWLSDNFKKAFNVEITPHTQFVSTIPLCIGESVYLKNENFVDEQSRQEAYAEILDTYKQVQDQGDGIKSFTGVLLYLMIDHFCTYLVDEPEAFLHPPQARIMGQIIGQSLRNHQQAFISTHCEDIIKGLLEVCPERVKIIRITRENDVNELSVLDNNRIREVCDDPLLKYSNIMSSLFYKSVVLCESDSDCKMYSIVEDYIKQKDGMYSETLFIHCGGKQRMAKIAKALRALNVNVKLIPDMDVMNDEKIFRDIIESFGIEWEAIRTDYNTINSSINKLSKNVCRETVCNIIQKILDESTECSLSKDEIKRIRNAIKGRSKWDDIKESGESKIPEGEPLDAHKMIRQILQNHGIFIVPVGELESFINVGNLHGPKWVNKVLETGDGGLVLLAPLAKVGGCQAPRAIEIIQTGYVWTAKVMLRHLLVFDLPNVPVDFGDQYGKGFKAVFHGQLLLDVEISTNTHIIPSTF